MKIGLNFNLDKIIEQVVKKLSSLVALGRNSRYKSWAIIDCAEVFTERQKPLDCQAATKSDYKRQNTIKVLVGISPSGFIYISK